MAADKRIILITGGNNGIGLDTAWALANNSAKNHVIVTARTLSKGEKAVSDLQARKPAGTISLVQLDVTDDESITTAAKKVDAEFGRLDVLVNNAGILLVGPPTRDQMQKVFDTNVFGLAVVTEVFAPLLKKSNDPRIINVSSGMGSIGERMDPTTDYYAIPGTAYRTSKSAVNMLTACQLHDYKEFKFKVWAYCPGYVVTDLSGPDTRQGRVDTGADSSETSAEGILQIVNGERDGETDKFVQRFGKTFQW